VVLGALVDRRRAAQIESDAYVLSNVHVKIAPDDFVDLLAGAGGVICSASVTAYEALALKKRVAVFSAADNQSGLGRILHGMKTAYDLGDWRMADENSIRGFFSFDPDIVKLSGLVNPRGALKCAEELLRGLSCLLKSGDRWDVLR
jgi:spore coat polysaccharide biosynthesis predicted glycosyltransferase SpsG